MPTPQTGAGRSSKERSDIAALAYVEQAHNGRTTGKHFQKAPEFQQVSARVGEVLQLNQTCPTARRGALRINDQRQPFLTIE